LAAIGTERVLKVHHWTDTQFTFTTTRDSGLRFENGQFVMVGLHVGDRPLLRAYSIASANHEEHLEFLSIKVPDGPLTSRLQHIRKGDAVLISRKPTGTLILHDLKPGKRLYLLSTGTGAAPFMSVIKDPEVYERFEHVVLVHGVRWVRESAVVQHFSAGWSARNCITTRRSLASRIPTTAVSRHSFSRANSLRTSAFRRWTPRKIA
jgi:ferredoxin--NADP+ reductase